MTGLTYQGPHYEKTHLVILVLTISRIFQYRQKNTKEAATTVLYFLYWILLCYIVLISFILPYSNELYCTLSYFKCVVLYWTIILFYCTKHYQAVVYLSKRNYTKSLYFYVLFCAFILYWDILYWTILYYAIFICIIL